MTFPRFSLKTVLATVTIAAIGCAALANPTELWASVIFSGTLALLGLAVVVAVMRRGGAIGFAICGWLYLGLILWPGAEMNIVPDLLTTKAIIAAETALRSESSDTVQARLSSIEVQYLLSVSKAKISVWRGNPFHQIGHCLFALLFAAVGGLVAGWLVQKQELS